MYVAQNIKTDLLMELIQEQENAIFHQIEQKAFTYISLKKE